MNAIAILLTPPLQQKIFSYTQHLNQPPVPDEIREQRE